MIKSLKYIIVPQPITFQSAGDKFDAEKEAQKLHERLGQPIAIYALVDTVGAKRYHYKVFNNDKLLILDSGDIKHFEGYETEVGAKWVAQAAARDIKLEPGWFVEIY